MKKFILLSLMIAVVGSTLLSCGSPPKKEDQASTSPENDGTSENFPSNTAIYLTVSSTWSAGGSATVHGTCSINNLASPNVRDCKIKIPEGQMYHSSISFTLGTKVSQICPMMAFVPYAYQISELDTDYTPNGSEEPAKCASELSKTPKCFGGAGPQIVSGYPEYTFMWFISAAGEKATFTLPAENTIRWYSSKPRKKNYLASNNMPPANRNTDIPGTYVGGTMNDYQFICMDLWYHPIYTINLELADEDKMGADGSEDEIIDWQ